MSGSREPRRSGLGLILLAVGRADGFTHFGTDTDAFLASLAPLVAFALVIGGLVALSGHVLLGAELFLLWLTGILAPAVIAHPLCVRWQRHAYWPLYANILNWSKLLFLMVAPIAFGLAASAPAAGAVMALALFAYGFWFHWFVARGALRLSPVRALLLLLATQLGTNLLVLLPLLADSGDRAQIMGN
jgi:hypothetical protein